MPFYSYHSTLIDDIGSKPHPPSHPSSNSTSSCNGASPTTSSQIFLSRGVAGPDILATTTELTRHTTVASIFESNSSHIMTLGDAAARTVSSQSGSHEQQDKEVFDSTLEDRMQTSSAINTAAHPPNSIFSEMPLITQSQGKVKAKDVSNLPLDLNLDHLSDCRGDIIPDPSLLPPSRGKCMGKEVARGRTLDRKVRSHNPLERAESRTRKKDPAIEIETRSIGKRAISRSSTFFDDPNDLEAVLEDRILEPCPHIPICNNVSEVLDTPSGSRTCSNTLMRRISTSTNNFTSLFPGPTLHPERASRACRKTITIKQVTTDTWLNPCARPNLDSNLPPIGPAMSNSLALTLPAEILQQIFLYLSPADFNSARRSCRSWFIHSLRKSLLELFLRRMGFSDAIYNITSSIAVSSDEDGAKYEWYLSKRIARECALGPNWSGNGIVETKTSEFTTKSAFKQISKVDFTEVAVHYLGTKLSGTVFTVSNCGRFLMAANGCLVYIYELDRPYAKDETYEHHKSGSLRPITSIICPLRVLACSMDTSSHRYAIAILLDRRMGVVCDITALGADPSSLESMDRYCDASKLEDQPRDSTHDCGKTVFLDRKTLKRASESEKGRPCQGTPLMFNSFATASPPFPSVNKSAWEDLFQDDTYEISSSIDHGTRHVCLPRVRIVESDNENSSDYHPQNTLPMPLEAGARSLYRNLCSEDDPPRSVAICPQRRCVAFGCSSGIELHWVDALTGQNLNRWFPLTAPSDFLFFLPPRQNLDSAKKLRLISSAGNPIERAAIAERQAGATTRSSPFWEEIGREMHRTSKTERFEGSQRINPRLAGGYGRRYTSGRIDASDHYRAIPLNDGYHILFTDPATGLLCLGSDAPLGGPTKLLRKIWFQGPLGKGTPVAYAGGSDLRAGIRVVAAFGSGEQQSIWLYSVPADIFSASQSEPSVLVGPMMQPGTCKNDPNTDWMAWWPDDGLQEWLKHAQDPVPGILPRSVWPVKIKGQEIGVCSGLADLTINSGPHMSVWAFGKDGLATVWGLDNGKGEAMQKFSVARDGTVKKTTGGDGSAHSSVSASEIFPMSRDTLDGTTSYGTQVHRIKRRRLVPPPEAFTPQLDADGDVVMAGVNDSERSERQYFVEEDYFEEILVEEEVRMRKMIDRACDERDTGNQRQRGVSVRVEELTGITRLDLEIQ